MESCLVLRGGKWTTVILPKGVSSTWNTSDCFYYASAWASAFETWNCTKKATQLAEAAVMKRLHSGLVYSKEFERDLATIWCKC
jgi:hypothetical protein